MSTCKSLKFDLMVTPVMEEENVITLGLILLQVSQMAPKCRGQRIDLAAWGILDKIKICMFNSFSPE